MFYIVYCHDFTMITILVFCAAASGGGQNDIFVFASSVLAG